MTDSTLFLTDDELVQLTAYRQPSKQREHLKKQRIPFHVNRAGHPRVARAVIEGRKVSGTEKPGWSPAWAESRPAT